MGIHYTFDSSDVVPHVPSWWQEGAVFQRAGSRGIVLGSYPWVEFLAKGSIKINDVDVHSFLVETNRPREHTFAIVDRVNVYLTSVEKHCHVLGCMPEAFFRSCVPKGDYVVTLKASK